MRGLGETIGTSFMIRLKMTPHLRNAGGELVAVEQEGEGEE